MSSRTQDRSCTVRQFGQPDLYTTAFFRQSSNLDIALRRWHPVHCCSPIMSGHMISETARSVAQSTRRNLIKDNSSEISCLEHSIWSPGCVDIIVLRYALRPFEAFASQYVSKKVSSSIGRANPCNCAYDVETSIAAGSISTQDCNGQGRFQRRVTPQYEVSSDPYNRICVSRKILR